MLPAIMFYGLPRDVRKEGEAPDAHESQSGVRGTDPGLLLREAPPGKSRRLLSISPHVSLTPLPQLEQLEVRKAMLATRSPQPNAVNGDGAYASAQANGNNSKTARAYAKTYKPGPPLVPRIMVARILQYVERIRLRHKTELVHLVCRYWSLKREARRGAPLLKRLHLEPWTALSGSRQQTDEEKAMKLDVSRSFKAVDFARLRHFVAYEDIAGGPGSAADARGTREETREPEARAGGDDPECPSVHVLPVRGRAPAGVRENQRVCSPSFSLGSCSFMPGTSPDRQGYFRSPVNKVEVPDYYDIIQNPMCWDTIDQKLDRHEYLDLAQFKVSSDLRRVYPSLTLLAVRHQSRCRERHGLQRN